MIISRGLALVVSVAARFAVAGAVGVVTLMLVLSAPARAGEPSTDTASQSPDADASAPRIQAQQLLRQGNELFRADRFAEALQVYREAQRLFPSPKILFNIARCEQSLDHRAPAMQNLVGFLKEAVDADPAVRAEAERLMAQLATTLAAVDVSRLPPNAKIAVDAETVGLTPLDRPLWLEPGSHRVSVDRPGRPLWVTTLDARAGTLTPLAFPEVEVPPAPRSGGADAPGPDQPSEPAAQTSFLRRTWWIWAAGLIVAGATTLIVVKLLECPETKCM